MQNEDTDLYGVWQIDYSDYINPFGHSCGIIEVVHPCDTRIISNPIVLDMADSDR